jgi:hypothetical protein
MQFQLVLQFPTDSLADFGSLVALEEDLIVQLEDLGEVDGHDLGAGEMNIFVLTSDPEASFGRVTNLLSEHGLLEKVTAAYRLLDGEDYSILWPKTFQGVFEIA